VTLKKLPSLSPKFQSLVLMEREYSWEELADLERDVSEAISEGPFPGEFSGRVVVKITYEGDDSE